MHKFCDNKFQQEEDSDMMSAWKGAEYFRIVKWFRGPGQAGGKKKAKNKTLVEKDTTDKRSATQGISDGVECT